MIRGERIQSNPISGSPPFLSSESAAADPSKAKDQIDRHHDEHQHRQAQQQQPSKMKFVRHQSSSSCYSTRSFLSNATGDSTRSHRRCSVEVSSILFTGSSPGGRYSERSQHTTERTDTYTKKEGGRPGGIKSRVVSEESSESYSAHTFTSEMRGPDADQFLSMSSSSSHVRVPSDDAPTSTGESKQEGSESEQSQADAASLRAIDLIRELSFEASLSLCGSKKASTKASTKKSAVASSTSSSALPKEIPREDSKESTARATSPVERGERQSELPPTAPTSPPLPPKINRIGLDQISSVVPAAVPSQIQHNRNRCRSTSISEMSESCLAEMLGDSSSNTSESSSDSKKKSDFQAGFDVAGKTSERKSLITIDNNVPPASPSLTPRPVSLFARGRTSSTNSFFTSDSSYISSSSDDMSLDSSGEESDDDKEEEVVAEAEEDVECLNYIDANDENLFFSQDSGLSSLQDGKIDAYPGDRGAEVDDEEAQRPRLNSEALREWNMICEEEVSNKGITNKDQYIFRAVSCPYKMSASASPERDGPKDDVDESAEEPHLMCTGLSHVMSEALFSYTNSGSPSTISDKPDDAVSDLDFDIGFIYSYSIEKSSISECLDARPVNNKCHRRSRSSGSGLRKPLGLPKAVLLNPEDTGARENGRLSNPCPTHKHRRFKSDGSIFCKNKQTILSEVNFSFSEAPSFKSKYGARHQRNKSLDNIFKSHERGKSLDFKGHQRAESFGSFNEASFFDCAPLQCILEEASRSSTSADGFQLIGLMAFLKQYPQHLENLDAIDVLKLGIVLGIVLGVTIRPVIDGVLGMVM